MSDRTTPLLRVLDLSMGWAGPLVSQLLAELPQVEVIKVEDTRNYDWWRGSHEIAPPEAQPIERAPTFNTANRGKLGLTLDLADSRGVELLKRLARVSDVVVENFTPRVMERLGLSYDELSSTNPRLVMLSMPACGSDGPECETRGYGMTMEALAGVTSTCAYHDNPRPYMLENALGDPVSGLNGAFALLVALHERERTGRGQRVEIAQVEGLIPFVGAQMVEYQVTGELPHRFGNRHPVYAPHGIFRCAGDDHWIAISVENDAQFQALAGTLSAPRLVTDARFAGADQRKLNEAALVNQINLLLENCDGEELAARLSAAGVPASTVNSAPQVLADRQLGSRQFFVPIERAVVGTHLYPSSAIRLSGTPLDPSRPAPLLGEHNARILREILGLDDAEIAELERARIIGTQPRQYDERKPSSPSE